MYSVQVKFGILDAGSRSRSRSSPIPIPSPSSSSAPPSSSFSSSFSPSDSGFMEEDVELNAENGQQGKEDVVVAVVLILTSFSFVFPSPSRHLRAGPNVSPSVFVTAFRPEICLLFFCLCSPENDGPALSWYGSRGFSKMSLSGGGYFSCFLRVLGDISTQSLFLFFWRIL